MSQIDPIADALTHIQNSENASKHQIMIKPASKLLGQILNVMQQKGYVGKIETTTEGSRSYFRVELLGRINKVSAIKPRYAVKKNDFEKYEKRYLPARDVGTIIVSTSTGVISHDTSKEKSIGGRLLAYIY